jgi:hypothetical protein
MRKNKLLLASLLFATTVSLGLQSSAQTGVDDWQARLKQQLPLLGHRNWILIVDSAYPLQTSPGIETIETSADQLAVTKAVLAAVDHSIHVRPIVYLDAELPYVPQKDYVEADTYREGLKKVLQGRPTNSLLHEQILGKIDEAGKTYKILVLKTTMTMPYTSVFLQLDCKYLDDAGEQKLRRAMKAASVR